jgi:hypothetical protein
MFDLWYPNNSFLMKTGSESAEPNPTTLFSKYHSLDDLRDMFRTILLPVVQELIQAQHTCCESCHCVNISSLHLKSMSKTAGLDNVHDSDSDRNCDAQTCGAQDSCLRTADNIDMIGANVFLKDSCRYLPTIKCCMVEMS